MNDYERNMYFMMHNTNIMINFIAMTFHVR
jgi:hypothetical protein